MGKQITTTRLEGAARLATIRKLPKLNERLDVVLSQDFLKCLYVGSDADDARLNSKTRIVYAWKMECGGLRRRERLRNQFSIKPPEGALCLRRTSESRFSWHVCRIIWKHARSCRFWRSQTRIHFGDIRQGPGKVPTKKARNNCCPPEAQREEPRNKSSDNKV